MTSRVEYRGRVFTENSDFVDEVRDAVRGHGASWLRTDLPLPWSISDWGESFSGTELRDKISDAALTIMETGTRDEAELASVLPFEHGSDAVARVLAILEREPSRLGQEPRALAMAIWRLLVVHSRDRRLLEFLRREAERPGADALLLEMAARHLS
jgi:hypothetical protein